MMESVPDRDRVLQGKIAWGLIFILLAIVCAGCANKAPSSPKPAAQWKGQDPIERIDGFIATHPVDKSNPNWKSSVPRPPFVQFDPNKKYYWYLTTNVGIIKIEFKPEWSPKHVSTAIYLTRLGYYDNLTFHRVIPGFMAQGGDPKGNGSGGPGFRIAGEFHKKGLHTDRGALSAANRGPRTDGSQFFITFKKAEQLDGKHTVYGQTVEGMGTLRTLESIGSKSGAPSQLVTIRRAEVIVD